IISFIVLGLFGIGYNRAAKNHQALLALQANAKKLSSDEKLEHTGEKGINTAKEEKKFSATKSALDQASRDSTGPQAAAAHAMSAFLEKARVPMVNFAKVSEPMKPLVRLDMSQVEQQEKLQTRMQTVKKFLAANDNLIAFIKDSEFALRKELVDAQLPQKDINFMVEGYRKTTTEQNNLALRMREEDKNIGNALTGALVLLDANWGKWKYSPAEKAVHFDDRTTGNSFLAYIAVMDAAFKEQSKLQHQLGALAKK
ncbi:MAG: hypothetical protein JWQ71_3658, partial [Pedosphaera sp.]|nr:hypothetical protein [Pedosphaera sp.]